MATQQRSTVITVLVVLVLSVFVGALLILGPNQFRSVSVPEKTRPEKMIDMMAVQRNSQNSSAHEAQSYTSLDTAGQPSVDETLDLLLKDTLPVPELSRIPEEKQSIAREWNQLAGETVRDMLALLENPEKGVADDHGIFEAMIGRKPEFFSDHLYLIQYNYQATVESRGYWDALSQVAMDHGDAFVQVAVFGNEVLASYQVNHGEFEEAGWTYSLLYRVTGVPAFRDRSVYYFRQGGLEGRMSLISQTLDSIRHEFYSVQASPANVAGEE